MTENIFFDTAKLKKVGKNVIIGKTVRIRYPELVEIGDNCIIDDFTYISTGLKLGRNVHIASGVKIIGGRKTTVQIDSFCGISSHAMMIAGCDDYMQGMNGVDIPMQYKGNMKFGNIHLQKHCMLAPFVTVMQGVSLAEGTAIDSYSRVMRDTIPWFFYAGNPAEKIIPRNKQQILEYEQQFLENEMAE